MVSKDDLAVECHKKQCAYDDLWREAEQIRIERDKLTVKNKAMRELLDEIIRLEKVWYHQPARAHAETMKIITAFIEKGTSDGKVQ